MRGKRELIFEMVMGLYLLVLAVDDMLKRSISVSLAAAGVIPVALSFVPGMSVCKVPERVPGLLLGLTVILIAKLTKEKIGYGDGIVLSVAGFSLGIVTICGVLTLSLLMLVAYSAAMLARGRLNRKSRVPFLPFLFAGYMLALAAGM